MGKIAKNEQGYSALELVLLVVVVAVIGFVGWYVHRASDTTYNTYNSATGESTNVAPKKKAVTKTTSTDTSASTPTTQ